MYMQPFVAIFNSSNILYLYSNNIFFPFKDFEPETVPIRHEQILSIITYIGCSLSFFGLTFTLFTMFIFKYVTTLEKWHGVNHHRCYFR